MLDLRPLTNAYNRHLDDAAGAGGISAQADQLAGLSALMSLSVPVALPPISPLPGYLNRTRSLDEDSPDARRSDRPTETKTSTTFGKIWSYLRSDHLLRDSLYLILNSGVQAALGFAFWVIAARLFSTVDVGQASSLISATTLIAFLALLGLNSAFVRYLPTAQDRNRLISAGLILVGLCGAIMAMAYILLTPLVAPRIAFVAHRLPLVIGFALLTAAGAVNVLTDAVFIAAGKANYNALVDGIAGGVTKVISVIILVGTGAYGIYCASTVGFSSAAIASVLLMADSLRWRPKARSLIQALKPMFRFSSANYIGNIANLVPTLVVPLIVLDRLGPSAAAYYFVPFQLATLLYSAVYAVEQAFLAEGSQDDMVSRALLLKSIRILLALCVPACILMFLFGHRLLLLFGTKYGNHAGGCLVMLAIAVFPIAAGNWSLTVLRLSDKLKAIVLSNIAYAAAICVTAWALAPHGLTTLASSWPIGASVGAVIAAVASKGSIPRREAGKHRTARYFAA
jgi:O-antigen/teichoic acid export membrane protein